MPTRKIEIRNGMRQPHELNASLLMKFCTMRITASETNNNYFTIERSADGMNFEKIGIVRGAGNSSEMIDYSYSDYAPLTGMSFYRLKQTDFDGKESYSSVIVISSEGKDFVRILPNPVNDKLYINMDAASDNVISVSIYNAFGQQVVLQNTNVNKGFNQLGIDVNNLSKGAYFLKIEYKDKVISNLVMKQ